MLLHKDWRLWLAKSGIIDSLVCAVCLVLFVSELASADSRLGLLGSTMTQDRVFIRRDQGSRVSNIFLYGWGSLWPDMKDGQDDEHDSGASIDSRVREALADGQDIMLSCATAPSNYRASRKPWNMQERITPDMEDVFAKHCADAVKRWGFTRVQVWNELKGYWNPGPAHRWDYEDYTRLYNKVYRSVRAVNPDVQIGGGYIVLSELGLVEIHNSVEISKIALDALRYWLIHADGYDAVCIDARRRPGEFVGITHYVRELARNKPIWWSEFYSDNSADMRAARGAIANDQHKDDVALWWAERQFDWDGESNSAKASH